MKKAIEWVANNTVAANLLMWLVLLAGFITLPSIKQEVFPEFSTETITISVPYLGAAPEEVEEGVCIKIEEQIQGIDGIEKITSKASEGSGVVTVELLEGADISRVLDDIKTSVDGIETFPEETESPIIKEVLVRQQVLDVAVFGDTDEKSLKVVGEQIRDDLSALPGITQVDLEAARPYEVSIEVSEDALRRYGLTFEAVARAVSQSSLDLPGGSVKTEGGEILLRTKGQAYRGAEFAGISLISRADGTEIKLGDVADVVDGFQDTDLSARFDGKPAVLLKVYRVGEQNTVEVSETVKDYLEREAGTFPEGIQAKVWNDSSELLKSRLELLLRNGKVGFFLVIVILTLFLRLKLSFWTSLGIPISFMGTIWLMPSLDVSINMISLFAFIVVLGIVVDDAIVVGEHIFHQVETGKEGIRAAVDGTLNMTVPVVFAVLTTMAAFAPLLFVPGPMGKVFRNLPLIVIPTLMFSLLECLFILPAHLSHLKHREKKSGKARKYLDSLMGSFDYLLKLFTDKVYHPLLKFLLYWRYATLAFSLLILLLTVGYFVGGRVHFEFMPDVEADNIVATLTLPLGTPVEKTSQSVAELERSLEVLKKELEEEGHGDVIRHVMTSIGSQPSSGARGPMAAQVQSAAHLAEVSVELVSSENRSLSSTYLVDRWRELTRPIPDVVALDFTSSLFNTGEDINIQFTAKDMATLRGAAEDLKENLREFNGVFDISDSFRAGKKEVKLKIKPEAEMLNLTQMSMARQIRQAFYGEEAQRIQRGRDDVRIMVRYSEKERETLGSLEEMRIRTPSGAEVPFSTVASAEVGRGFSTIDRVDRRRAINVTAAVNPAEANANEIIARLEDVELPAILARYPGLSYSLEGQQKEMQDSMAALAEGFLIAIIFIFVLVAVPLKSYIQPLIIMSAIPFGLVGALIGHIIMGYNVSMLSMFGVVALAGVVVNDSLILVDTVNKNRAEGMNLYKAVTSAGVVRLRPILLTSLTTFGGLMPLILEKSLQARFMIPMAISLGFGIMFATIITLVLVPTLYIILADLRHSAYWLVGREDVVKKELWIHE